MWLVAVGLMGVGRAGAGNEEVSRDVRRVGGLREAGGVLGLWGRLWVV